MWLGRADPVLTMETARDEDPERAALAERLAGWQADIGVGWEHRRTVAEVLKTIEERDPNKAGEGNYPQGYERPYLYPVLREAVLATAFRGHIDARGFGNCLRRHKSRIVDGMRFAAKADEHGHRAEWWVEKC